MEDTLVIIDNEKQCYFFKLKSQQEVKISVLKIEQEFQMSIVGNHEISRRTVLNSHC